MVPCELGPRHVLHRQCAINTPANINSPKGRCNPQETLPNGWWNLNQADSQKWDSPCLTLQGKKWQKVSFRYITLLGFVPIFFLFFFADKNKETQKQLMEENMRCSLHSFTETCVYQYPTMYSKYQICKYIIAYINANNIWYVSYNCIMYT